VSNWPAVKARRVLAALSRIGWTVKRTSGSHKTLSRTDWPDVVFARNPFGSPRAVEDTPAERPLFKKPKF